MREIKFRAWFYDGENLSTGAMVSLETAISECYAEVSAFDLSATDKCTILMQYTGLKDKNGVEIYEGDIIKNFWVNNETKEEEIWIVKFGEYLDNDVEDFAPAGGIGFYCDNSCNQKGIVNLYQYKNIEVIGNIHENPELLEVKE